ncbi:MAG: CAP domain-containing protein [Candidatus Melainabacteria bacterium]|nr:CAP domain-containing protein [Candidatus Melainabacteria bacterium]
MRKLFYKSKAILSISLVLSQSLCFNAAWANATSLPSKKPTKSTVKSKAPASTLIPMKPVLDSGKKDETPLIAPDCKATKDKLVRKATSLLDQKTDNAPYLSQIKRLEEVMFADHSGQPGGKAGNGSLNDRLSRLEMALFGETHPKLSMPDRLKKLQESLYGSTSTQAPKNEQTEKHDSEPLPNSTPNTIPPTVDNQIPGIPPDQLDPGSMPTWTDNTIQPRQPEFQIVESFLNSPEATNTITPDEMKLFALYVINAERQARGLSPLEADSITDNMAKTHITELATRRIISHTDLKGKNPDQRLTDSGGSDAVEECLAAITTGNLKSAQLNKMVGAALIKMMLERQDDREALLNPDATHLSMQFSPSSDQSAIFSCAEVLTRKGTYEAIPKEVSVQEDIHVSGTLNQPLTFDRITLAYEELNDVPIEEDPASKEALPYFPPLDFIAHRQKSEKDYSKLIIALKGLGVAAAIAGGVFMPPVALAAPLIVMAGPGGIGSPIKPQSDIPIKGGIKVKGANFSGKVSISNEGKPGIYYVTVWAISGNRSIPVSRRTVTARLVHEKKDKEDSKKIEYTEDVESKVESPEEADAQK